jgi:flagellar assembly protein FliH
MGKVVKSATFDPEKYVVSVPRLDAPAAPASAPEVDTFASFTGRRSYDDDGIAPEEFEAPPAPAKQVDWETLRADAEAIIDHAAADAESLLKQAQEHALELLKSAEAHANELRDSARSEGHDAGYAEGKGAAEAELSPVIATMREVLQSTLAQRQEAVNAAEPELVRLAMAIAERIVHSEISANPNVVVDNVRQALTRLVSREVVTLRLNPADLDMIRQHRDDIVEASDVEHLRIVEDARVDRGGVLIETEAGTIDAKISTQLREAKRAILTEEDFAVSPPAYAEHEMLHEPAQAS